MMPERAGLLIQIGKESQRADQIEGKGNKKADSGMCVFDRGGVMVLTL